MKYYWFNKEKLLKNAWNKYHNKGGKQKAAKHYAARNKYRNLSEKEKNKKKKYQSERYHMNSDLNERLKNNKEIIVLEKKNNNTNNNLFLHYKK